jgi:hypothetical protein
MLDRSRRPRPSGVERQRDHGGERVSAVLDLEVARISVESKRLSVLTRYATPAWQLVSLRRHLPSRIAASESDDIR